IKSAFPAVAGAVYWDNRFQCFPVAGRNARSRHSNPFDTHAPARDGCSLAGIREFLEPQVLSQLLPTFVWSQKWVAPPARNSPKNQPEKGGSQEPWVLRRRFGDFFAEEKVTRLGRR